MSLRDNTAVVLSGGGAYAAYEVGVLAALINGESPASKFVPLAPDIYTGTSAGAINAVVLTAADNAHDGIRTLENTWYQLASGEGRCGNNVYRVRGNVFQLFDTDCYRRGLAATVSELAEDSAFLFSDFLQRGFEFMTSREPVGQRALELFDLASFISTDRIKQVLASVVIPQRIRQSSVILRVVATNWRTGRGRAFTNQDFTDELGISPVLATAAIPGILPHHKIDGVPYVDGTVVENTPLKPSIGAGASTIHVIEPPDPAYFPPDPIPSAIETFYRTIITMLNVLMQRDLEHAAELNRGVELLQKLNAGGTVDDPDLMLASRAIVQNLARTGVKQPYRLLTIHRYAPTHQFGGLTGLLDFRRRNIVGMIEAGYRSAVQHDCTAAGCEIPDKKYQNDNEVSLQGELAAGNRPFNGS